LTSFPPLFEWVLINPPETQSQVQTLLFDTQSNLWFATLKGLYKTHLDPSGGNTAVPIMLRTGLKQPIITSIYEDGLSNIWIGTFDEGIFFQPAHSNSFIKIRQPDGLANDNVLSISGDGNSIWISTLGGVTRCSMNGTVSKKSDLHFENFDGESGLHSNYIYQTFVDSKKRVWFATDGNGLKVLDAGGFKTYDQIDSNKLSTVYSIAEDKAGNIWFSTPSDGLYKFDGEQFTNYGMQSGISDLSITGIVADANGDILLMENDAIDIFESKTNQVRRYRGRPSFDNISPNLNSFYNSKNGSIWIATQKGILKYYAPPPKFTHEARHEIRHVLVYLEAIDFQKIHKLKYNQNHLTFEFQAFWNSNPSQLRYRYMLEGYDLDWIKTKDERAIYPELRPGTYTFKIQSTIHHNFDDAQTKSYSFTITPPFWSTWWFVSICSLVTSIVLFWLVKIVIKEGHGKKSSNASE
jgi:ligand-binding sensor domain-containing protein